MSGSGVRHVTTSRSERGILRAAALTLTVLGAVGSVALMLYVGRRNPSIVLLAMFVVWVLGPYVVMLRAYAIASGWPELTRTTLYALMLIIPIGTNVIYGRVAWYPHAQPAFYFLVIPVASLLLLGSALLMAWFVSRRQGS
jgi:hypothetical protein